MWQFKHFRNRDHWALGLTLRLDQVTDPHTLINLNKGIIFEISIFTHVWAMGLVW